MCLVLRVTCLVSYGAKTPVYTFVPLYVPVALPVGIVIPQYISVLTAVVLVGEVRRKPETLVDASLNACSFPPKVKLEGA